MTAGDLICPFRLNPRQENATEIATCGRLQQLLQVDGHNACDVTREACEACVQSTALASSFVNGIFPSILTEACEKYLNSKPVDDDAGTGRAVELQELSEQAVIDDLDDGRCNLVACDVFLPCTEDSAEVRHSIDSILNQQGANVHLHLIIDSPEAAKIADEYASRWNVLCHRQDSQVGFFRVVHELATKTRSEFIALQHPEGISAPNRIAAAVSQMQRTGSDLVGSSMTDANGTVPAKSPTGAYEHAIPWPTLVYRRSLFIDLGGFADRQGDQDIELVHRAKCSGAKVRLLNSASVRLNQAWTPPALGDPPDYASQFGSLRHHAIGYPQSTVACDVVVPIYGQLPFVRQAIESVIEQQGAEAIVHLVDDAGPENVDDLFRYWGSHPRVRLYRNLRNVGQYVSFNNVSSYLETDLVAIQDGDDVSLPHRLHTSGNLLQLCDADFFAAKMEHFGEDDATNTEAAKYRLRRSHHPFGDYYLYFAMNPTVCFRVSAFRHLGGYTDFGGRDRNRGGLDSEFMIRAYFAGLRFAFSSRVVSRHRLHGQAATRRPETGFRSASRKFALDECRRRLALFRDTRYDPRSFGALGRYQDVTERIS